MISLLDVQKNIRELEKQAADLTEKINEIYSEIEMMRTADRKVDVDYSTIRILAEKYSFSGHPIGRLTNMRAVGIYLKTLLSIVRLDADSALTVDRLVLIQRILQESKKDLSLQELYQECYQMKSDYYREMTKLIPEKYQESLVVDMLIVANIGGVTNSEIYEYIAEIAFIFGISGTRLKILSYIAKMTLCQKAVDMNGKEMTDFKKMIRQYRHYIRIETMRQIVVELPDSHVKDFKWKVQQEREVEKDQILAVYAKVKEENVRSGKKSASSSTFFRQFVGGTENLYEIKAPSAGTIFQFRYKCTNYGVLASSSDNKDSIKEWVKAKKLTEAGE